MCLVAFVMITIEGTKFRARMIPRDRIVSVWKTLTERPFPRVAAFQLTDNDFELVIELIRCADDERREMVEWGRTLSAKDTDGCVYNTDEFLTADYLVLIRKNPYHRFEEVLKHELSHIAKGDL
jgi:hypothetical protein